MLKEHKKTTSKKGLTGIEAKPTKKATVLIWMDGRMPVIIPQKTPNNKARKISNIIFLNNQIY